MYSKRGVVPQAQESTSIKVITNITVVGKFHLLIYFESCLAHNDVSWEIFIKFGLQTLHTGFHQTSRPRLPVDPLSEYHLKEIIVLHGAKLDAVHLFASQLLWIDK